MSLENDYTSLDANIEAFVDVVYQKAIDRFKYVVESDSSNTLGGLTPTEIKDRLKNIILEHMNIHGQNVHNQTPEDLGTLPTDEILRYFESNLAPVSNLPTSAYGDCTYLGFPLNDPRVLPVNPDITFPGAFLELDDLGNLYIMRAYTDGNESYPYFSVLLNARGNYLANVKITSNPLKEAIGSDVPPTRIVNGVIGFDKDTVFFSTKPDNRHLQHIGLSKNQMPIEGYQMATAGLQHSVRRGNSFTVKEKDVYSKRSTPSQMYKSTLTKLPVRRLHKVVAKNRTFYVGYCNDFNLNYVERHKNRASALTSRSNDTKGTLDFFELSGNTFVKSTLQLHDGSGWLGLPDVRPWSATGVNGAYALTDMLIPFITTGMDTVTYLENDHLPLMYNYTRADGQQMLALYMRYVVESKTKIHPPYSFYCRLDARVTDNGHLDFSIDMGNRPTLQYDLTGYKWITEKGAPFKHQSFLRLLERHGQSTLLLERNVGFIYSCKTEGSVIELTRFAFTGSAEEFVRDSKSFREVETEPLANSELTFPSRNLRAACGIFTGMNGNKRLSAVANYAYDTFRSENAYVLRGNPEYGFSGPGNEWGYYPTVRDIRSGNYLSHTFATRGAATPEPITEYKVFDKYRQRTGLDYIYNPVYVGWVDSGSFSENWSTSRIVSSPDGYVTSDHATLIYVPSTISSAYKNGFGKDAVISPTVGNNIRSQILPYLPANRTMWVWEASFTRFIKNRINRPSTHVEGACIIRYIVPSGSTHVCKAMIVPITCTFDTAEEADQLLTSGTLDFSKMVPYLDNLSMDVKPRGLVGHSCGTAVIASYRDYRTYSTGTRWYITESYEIERTDGEKYTFMSAFEFDSVTGKAKPTMISPTADYNYEWAVYSKARVHCLAKINSKLSPTWTLMNQILRHTDGSTMGWDMQLMIAINPQSYHYSTLR